MNADDVFRNRESQTGAARFARSRFVHTIETFEQARQVFRRNAWTVVTDKKLHRSLLIASADIDSSARVLNGIVDQVSEHLVNCVFVGEHFAGRAVLDPEFDSG